MKILIFALVFTMPFFPYTLGREVTHEDIRDAMLSLVHMFRASEDKLERHEFREKALGEQLKKALAGLDKRHRSLDPLKGAISRLDERLSNVETILIQKDEREKQQLQKTNEIIDTIQSTLHTWSANIASVIKTEINGIHIPTPDTTSTNNKLAVLEENVNTKIEGVKQIVDSIKGIVINLKENQKVKEDVKESNLQDELFIKHIDETEKLLTKYDSKLMEYHVNISKINTEPDPLGEISLADEAWHNKMTIALEKQQTNMQDIQKSLQNIEEAVKELPSKTDVDNLKNQTIGALQEANYDQLSNSEKGVMRLSSQLSDMKTFYQQTQDEITKSIVDTETMSETMHSEVVKSYEQLRAEVQTLSKGEKVMIQTADNVLDTKRRIEYGIHQILLEIGALVTNQGKDLNQTLNQRFDDIEHSIVDSQTGAMANLSTKIEHEISQVWRQIGIMYQQVTASNTALDRLQAQTEQYVNGTVKTMDSMEGKVGMITSRMSAVDENLNYLLGKLSFVTREFNQIRIGLGDALDNIKDSFLVVQSKIKEAGPGPHNIPKTEMPSSEENNK